MIMTKRTGIGTVNQTIYEELLTPLNTQRKMINQVTKVDSTAHPEKTVGSPSYQDLQFPFSSAVTNLIT